MQPTAGSRDLEARLRRRETSLSDLPPCQHHLERARMRGCMKNVARLLTICVASLSALALPGCGGERGDNNFFGVFGFGGADIRFLNGSPDTGAVDVAGGDPARIVFSNVVYGSITAYVQYSDRSSPDVYVYQHNSQTLIGGHVTNDANLAV